VASDLSVRRVLAGEESAAMEAARVFDHPPDESAVRAFLADASNCLLIGYVDGRPAGMIRAHLLRRLDDERPQMFLYELGVHEDERRLGLGSMLVREIVSICGSEGCREMFVLTSADNEPAMLTYASAGGTAHPDPDHVTFEWTWPAERKP